MIARGLALVVKDLRLHGISILAAQTGVLALAWVLFAMRPSSGSVELSFVFNANLVVAPLWSEWLVSREKTKGTIAWLRTLPIDDRVIVFAKASAAASCAITLWAASSLMLARSYFAAEGMPAWIVLQLALLVFGAITLAARWRLRQKAAQVLPFMLLFAVLLCLLAFEKWDPDTAAAAAGLWRDSSGRWSIAAALAAGYVAIIWATASWVSRVDTARLME
jgi:hypothetical protein